jgi:large subunit ribosomal protein L9
VNNLHIAEELAKLGLEVNRKIIVLKDVKEVGSYVALVKLHKDVTANVAFDVVAEGASVEAASEEA